MKNLSQIALLALLSISSYQLSAQTNQSTPAVPDFTTKTVNKGEWKMVTELFKTQKWADAEKMATGYLARAEKDAYHTEDAAILRYMIINAVSEQLAENLLDSETALKKVKPFEGKEVITPSLTFKSKAILNSLVLSDNGLFWTQTLTNKEQDAVVLKEVFNVAFPSMLQETTKYDGKNFRMRAIVAEITANNPAHPHFDVVYNKTEIWDIYPAR